MSTQQGYYLRKRDEIRAKQNERYQNDPEHREYLKNYAKEHYEINKEYFNKSHECACGRTYTTKHRTRHFNTKIHKQWASTCHEI